MKESYRCSQCNALLFKADRAAIVGLIEIKCRRCRTVNSMRPVMTVSADPKMAKLISLFEQHEAQPRFVGRRSIDKSCGEVVEVTDADCVPENGYPVVKRIELPNFEGEAAAIELAASMSRQWLADQISQL